MIPQGEDAVAAEVEAEIAAAAAATAALVAVQAVIQGAAPELAQALAAGVVFVPVIVVEDQLRHVADSGEGIVPASVQGLSSVN